AHSHPFLSRPLPAITAAPFRSAPFRSAPFRSGPFQYCRSTPVPSRPVRSAPDRSIPLLPVPSTSLRSLPFPSATIRYSHSSPLRNEPFDRIEDRHQLRQLREKLVPKPPPLELLTRLLEKCNAQILALHDLPYRQRAALALRRHDPNVPRRLVRHFREDNIHAHDEMTRTLDQIDRVRLLEVPLVEVVARALLWPRPLDDLLDELPRAQAPSLFTDLDHQVLQEPSIGVAQPRPADDLVVDGRHLFPLPRRRTHQTASTVASLRSNRPNWPP